MKRWAKLSSGFTIVELLIVIVVIAVLASITVVAFNGIQERARISGGLSFERQLHSKYGANATGDWSFDECSGNTASNNGTTPATDTIQGATHTWITDTATGKGCALRMNGGTRVETAAGLGGSYYVKAAWIRVTSSQACVNIMSRGVTAGASTGADAPFWLTGCRLTAGYQGNYTAVQGAETINDGKWHYVAVIWEDGNLTLYNDGRRVASTASTPAPTPIGGNVSIGSHGTGNFFVGDIDNPFVAAE